jgi:protein TonB
MKKNRVFPVMIGLSLALHGFVFFGWAGSDPSVPPPEPESQSVTKVKLTRMVKTPPQSVPAPVPVQRQEQKVVEKKPVEIPPEPAPQQGAETIAEAREGDEHITQETDGGESGTITGSEYSEPDGNHEYEELLAYISGLIRQNLLYPQMARRRNIEGIVGVYFEIGIDGGLLAVRVNHSSGSSILDNAAVSLVKKLDTLKNMTTKRKLALNINIVYKLTE